MPDKTQFMLNKSFDAPVNLDLAFHVLILEDDVDQM